MKQIPYLFFLLLFSMADHPSSLWAQSTGADSAAPSQGLIPGQTMQVNSLQQRDPMLRRMLEMLHLQQQSPGLDHINRSLAKKSPKKGLASWQDAYRDGYVQDRDTIYLLLAATYAARRQFKQAYVYQKLHSESVYKATHTIESRTMAQQYDAEKRQALGEKQLLIQQQLRQLRQRDIFLLSISIGLFLLLFSILFIYKKNIREGKLRAAQTRSRYQQEQLQNIQARTEGENYERQRMAHELHDGIVNQLLALHLNINALQGKGDQMMATHQLDNIALQIKEAIEELCQTAENIIPDLLLEQGLCLSVASLCEKTAAHTQLDVIFQAYGKMPKLLPEIALSIYRMIQELLHNTLRHAKATQLIIQIGSSEDSLNITVEDNGSGFAAEVPYQNNPDNMGLQNLRQRVHFLNGQLDIKSEIGKGTNVYIEFNLEKLDRKENAFTQRG